MNKIRIFILMAVLVVALVATTVVSAAPNRAIPIPCPDGGAACTSCNPSYYGWYCIKDASMRVNPNSNIGDINYYNSGCSWSYYSDCTSELCHCMPTGYSDHCASWNH